MGKVRKVTVGDPQEGKSSVHPPREPSHSGKCVEDRW